MDSVGVNRGRGAFGLQLTVPFPLGIGEESKFWHVTLAPKPCSGMAMVKLREVLGGFFSVAAESKAFGYSCSNVVNGTTPCVFAR